MKNKLIETVKKTALALLVYFAFWGVLQHYFNPNMYAEIFEKQVKVINIEAEAKIHSPVSKK